MCVKSSTSTFTRSPGMGGEDGKGSTLICRVLTEVKLLPQFHVFKGTMGSEETEILQVLTAQEINPCLSPSRKSLEIKICFVPSRFSVT